MQTSHKDRTEDRCRECGSIGRWLDCATYGGGEPGEWICVCGRKEVQCAECGDWVEASALDEGDCITCVAEDQLERERDQADALLDARMGR